MTEKQYGLPQGHLTDEIHLAVDAETWREVTTKLKAEAPNEACCFLLTRPSRGVIRTTVLMREIIWPRLGEVVSEPGSLEVSAHYISRALDAAVDAGPLVGLCLVHTHPWSDVFGDGLGRFSPRDDWYERRLFPTVILGRPTAISASVVLGSAGDIDARVWWSNPGRGLTQAAHAIRIVGPGSQFLKHLPRPGWTTPTPQ